jgi:hypothetical protein
MTGQSADFSQRLVLKIDPVTQRGMNWGFAKLNHVPYSTENRTVLFASQRF